jgi:hypothetical protein
MTAESQSEGVRAGVTSSVRVQTALPSCMTLKYRAPVISICSTRAIRPPPSRLWISGFRPGECKES